MRLKLLYSTIVVLCLTITQVIGQGITVSGKVTSAEDGGGLPGVNVIIKGTTAGAVTDVEGNYKLNAPSGDAILVFSFVGYTNQEVPIQARTTVDVVLALDVSQLEEIVVTGSAVGKSKKTLSFAV
ncbi:MAG: carboxypeptidase-like regulatory domain-containing protein, partial [Cyclobacteriaceae bacterium]|nr:carboxypeptidase-like regulatory domain-containing protein [Cyclobacteriaceae bacterium]